MTGRSAATGVASSGFVPQAASANTSRKHNTITEKDFMFIRLLLSFYVFYCICFSLLFGGACVRALDVMAVTPSE